MKKILSVLVVSNTLFRGDCLIVNEPNEDVIRDFIVTWSNLDAHGLAEYFTDDGIYHNMPMEPVSGKENIRNFIAGFIQPWTKQLGIFYLSYQRVI